MKKGIKRYRQQRPTIDLLVVVGVEASALAVRAVNMFANRNMTKVGGVQYTPGARVRNILEGASLVVALVQQTERLKLWRRSPGFAPRVEAMTIPVHAVRVASGVTAASVLMDQLIGRRAQTTTALGKVPAVVGIIGAGHLAISSGIELWLRREAVARQARMVNDIVIVWCKSFFGPFPKVNSDLMQLLIEAAKQAGRKDDSIDRELRDMLDTDQRS